jgi:hypothetical protein
VKFFIVEKGLTISQIQKQVLSKEIILNNIWYISVFKITGEKATL